MGNCFWWDGGDQFQNLIGLGISMMSKMMVQMIQTMFFFLSSWMELGTFSLCTF